MRGQNAVANIVSCLVSTRNSSFPMPDDFVIMAKGIVVACIKDVRGALLAKVSVWTAC